MVIAAPEPKAEIQQFHIGEQRVVIRGLSWEAYLQILHALPQARASRLTYKIIPVQSLRTWFQQFF